jgi:hypothetical protein
MAKRVRVTKRAKKIRRRQRQSRRAYRGGDGEVNTSVGISPRVVKECRNAENLAKCIKEKMGQKSNIRWNRGIQE